MENPRPEKVAVVDEVRERLDGSDGVVVTEYRGLSVSAMSELRSQMRGAGGSYTVYKNTLVRRAANELGLDIEDLLVGPTALAFTETTPDGEPGDVVAVAKALRDFAKANPDLVIKGGLLDGNVMDADGVRALADVEPREVLLAKLAGVMQAPMANFAALLNTLPTNFAYALQALIDQGGASDAPAAADSDPEPAGDIADEADTPAADGGDDTNDTPAEDTPAEDTPAEPAAEADDAPDSGDAS